MFKKILIVCAGIALASSSAHAQEAKGIVGEKEVDGVTTTSSTKLAMSKDELGIVNGRRTVRGALRDSDSELSDGSVYDLHTATFRRGQQVTIRMASDDFDCYLILARSHNGEIETLAEDDDSGGGLDSEVSYRVEEPGEYMVIANGASSDSRGLYSIEIRTQGGSSGAVTGNAGSGSVSQTTNGRLTPGSDERLGDGSLYDLIEFEGRRGQHVELSLDSEDFDPVLALYFQDDGELTHLSEDDDSGEGVNSLIRINLPYTGTYVALANALNEDDLGAYQLKIRAIEESLTSMPNANWEEKYPGGGDPNEQYAVLVGIDDYPGSQNDLLSCVTDTRVVRKTLIDHFGFNPENIVVINDASATRDHIIEAFRRHLGQAGPDGATVFYFSGHGTQMDGDYGTQDDEADGVDEAIFVWGQDTASSIILDDEINVLIGELNAGSQMMILDNCNSGTGTLGDGFKFISFEDESMKSSLRLPDTWLEGNVLASTKATRQAINYFLFAACKADETALAGSGSRPSVFTQEFVKQVEDGGAYLSADEFMRRVKMSVRSYINDVLQREHLQTPQLEGGASAGTVGEAFGQR